MAEKTMWVAFVDEFGPKLEARVLPVQVTETAKQYKICKPDGSWDNIVNRALRYRSVINKEENRTLFNTKEEAATALLQRVANNYEEKIRACEKSKAVVEAVKLLITSGVESK